MAYPAVSFRDEERPAIIKLYLQLLLDIFQSKILNEF